MQSSKPIIRLGDLVAERIFILPKSMANSIDPVTGAPCIWVGVNGQSYTVLVERPVPIPYNVFCALKDVGILEHYETYKEGEDVN